MATKKQIAQLKADMEANPDDPLARQAYEEASGADVTKDAALAAAEQRLEAATEAMNAHNNPHTQREWRDAQNHYNRLANPVAGSREERLAKAGKRRGTPEEIQAAEQKLRESERAMHNATNEQTVAAHEAALTDYESLTA